MIAPKNILVATDFGEPALRALHYGAEFARAFGARLHILHVVDDLAVHALSSVGVPPIDFPSLQIALENEAQTQVNALVTVEGLGGLDVVASVLRGTEPGRAIVGYARSHDIDMVVVGTHGRGSLADFFLGSVAQRVVRSAPCPVLTVRAHEREFVQPEAMTERQRQSDAARL